MPMLEHECTALHLTMIAIEDPASTQYSLASMFTRLAVDLQKQWYVRNICKLTTVQQPC